jgi:hypothetical protein
MLKDKRDTFQHFSSAQGITKIKTGEKESQTGQRQLSKF